MKLMDHDPLLNLSVRLSGPWPLFVLRNYFHPLPSRLLPRWKIFLDPANLIFRLRKMLPSPMFFQKNYHCFLLLLLLLHLDNCSNSVQPGHI